MRGSATPCPWTSTSTLRHVVFEMDKWFTVPILGGSFDPIGLPNSGSVDVPWPGLDQSLTPTFAEALSVRTDRVRRSTEYLETVVPDEFTHDVVVLENGDEQLLHCLHTVFEEEFWHNRSARRDLELPASS